MRNLSIAALCLVMVSGVFYFLSSSPNRENKRAVITDSSENFSGSASLPAPAKPPIPSNPSTATVAKSDNTTESPFKVDADGRMFLPRFSERFHFPAPIEREKYIQEVLGQLKTPLQTSKYWLARSVIDVQGKRIPVTFIATLYDAADRRSPDPLRSLTKPELLAWIAVGYFNVDGDLIKKTMSSLIENIARHEKNYYLYLMSSDTGSLDTYFEYIALPVPGSRGIAAEVLESGPGKKWKQYSSFSWTPVTEAGYRDLMDEVDRASHY